MTVLPDPDGEGIALNSEHGWLLGDVSGPAKLLEMRVHGKWWYWLWHADVFLGPVPLLKLHFAFLTAITVGVWR